MVISIKCVCACEASGKFEFPANFRGEGKEKLFDCMTLISLNGNDKRKCYVVNHDRFFFATLTKNDFSWENSRIFLFPTSRKYNFVKKKVLKNQFVNPDTDATELFFRARTFYLKNFLLPRYRYISTRDMF